MLTLRVLLLSMSASALLFSAAAEAYDWTPVPIPTLGGSPLGAGALGFNNLGHVVGGSFTSDGAYHAYLFRDGAIHDLYTLGASSGVAQGINDAGQIAGSVYTPQGASRALLYDYQTGNRRELGVLPGGSESGAYAVNNAGQAVGYSQLANSAGTVGHAVVFDNGTVTDLGTLSSNAAASSTARDISNAGHVVGSSDADGGPFLDRHAFLYSNGVMQDLGTLYGGQSTAYAVNDLGQVVGSSTFLQPRGSGTLTTAHAFLYDGGVMRDIDTLSGAGSHAWDINIVGEVVGGYTTATGSSRAFFYKDGVMTDLNDLVALGDGRYFNDALGINDRGDILATDNLGNDWLVSTIPEPESAVLLLAGLGLMGIVRRGRFKKQIGTPA